MDNKDKKLEEFFRNRVNDFDTQDGDWDKPDISAFQNAQQHFPKRPSKKVFKRNRSIIFLLLFLLLGMSVYMFCSKKNKAKIEKELNQTKKELQIAKTDLVLKNNELTSIKDQLKQREEKSSIAENINSNQVSNHQAPTFNKVSKKDFIQKETTKKSNSKNHLFPTLGLAEDKKEKSEIISIVKNNNKNTLLKQIDTLKEFVSLEKLPAPPLYLVENKTSYFTIINRLNSSFQAYSPVLASRQYNPTMELGAYYVSNSQKTPFDYSFEKLEEETFNKNEKQLSLITKGYQVTSAFPLQFITRNLWLSFGFRKTKGSIEESFATKLIYSKDGEYLDDQGKTVNQLNIITRSSVSDAGSTIDFEIPSSGDIQDGEFIYAEWNHFQDFSFTHIPIGLNYFLGRGKLKLLFQGGVGWNKVSFGEYFVDANLKYDDELLTIKENDKKEGKEFSYNFMNGYAGVGLDYSINSEWSIRTSFSLEKNFIQSDKFLASNALNQTFQIGLNFKL